MRYRITLSLHDILRVISALSDHLSILRLRRTPLITRSRKRSRTAAILFGIIAALSPVALLAYDAGSPTTAVNRVIAQATATAAPKAATPTATTAATAAPKATAAATAVAPKTGTAGTLATKEGAGLTAGLFVLAIGVILGARAMAGRRA